MHARSLVYLAARARVAVALAPQSGHNSAHDTLARGILRSLEPLGARGHNDFASDGHGGVYLSASGVYDIKAPITGAVLHMSADGKTLTEVADTIHYSNGLTLDKGQRHLLVAEMLAGRVLSFPIGADEDRKLVRTIEVATPYVTNIAFGPNGADTVFVTGAFEQWKPPYPGAVYRWTR